MASGYRSTSTVTRVISVPAPRPPATPCLPHWNTCGSRSAARIEAVDRQRSAAARMIRMRRILPEAARPPAGTAGGADWPSLTHVRVQPDLLARRLPVAALDERSYG